MPDTATLPALQTDRDQGHHAACRVSVIWIDWYAYHVARFRGLMAAFGEGAVGIELVGGIGVHAGLKFREDLPADLRVQTLLPESSWRNAGKVRLSVLLWRRLSRLQPAIVLVPGYYTLPAIAAAIWAKTHGKLSVLMTESTMDDHQRTWWKEAMKSFLIRTLFDRAVAGGQAHVRYLNELGFAGDRIGAFYDVVDNEGLRKATLELQRGQAGEFGLPSKYFLYVGRLAPEKNVEGLLASWMEYRAAGGNWPLVIVGDGPSAPALRQMVAEGDAAQAVHFAGHRGSRELPMYYAFAGCFVLPSTREPWGLVVNEAMASGLPVLVSNRCGCAEDLVVAGQNGFVFDPADGVQLTRRMSEIASLDAGELLRMANNSSRIISRFSPESFGREIAKMDTSIADHVRIGSVS